MTQALYRTYRPRTFGALVGQQHVAENLRQQVLRDELSHAYLFSGTRGTGKTSAAKILAQAVNCLNPQEGEPCNECAHCKAILDGKFMDVVEMDAASNNSVDDIRELKERVIYPPSLGRYRVYIVDEVHMLSRGAFNALLKILEEPPKSLIFILATTEPQKIPPTILSRCQRYLFRRIGVKDMMGWMENILQQEAATVDARALLSIAKHAQGAMRDALSLLDQVLGYGKSLSYAEAMEALGLTQEEILYDLVRNLFRQDVTGCLKAVEEAYTQGTDMVRLTEEIIELFRELLIVDETTAAKEILEREDLSDLEELAKETNFAGLLHGIEALGQTLQRQRYASDPRQILEVGLLRLARGEIAGEDIALKALEERIRRLEEGAVISSPSQRLENIQASHVEEIPMPQKVLPSSREHIEKFPQTMGPLGEEGTKESTLTSERSVHGSEQPPSGSGEENHGIMKESTDGDIHSVWRDVETFLRQNNQVSVAVLLQDAIPVGPRDGCIWVYYEMENSRYEAMIRNEKNQIALRDACEAVLGYPVEVRVDLKENPKDVRESSREMSQKDRLQEEIKRVNDLLGEEHVQEVDE